VTNAKLLFLPCRCKCCRSASRRGFPLDLRERARRQRIVRSSQVMWPEKLHSSVAHLENRPRGERANAGGEKTCFNAGAPPGNATLSGTTTATGCLRPPSSPTHTPARPIVIYCCAAARLLVDSREPPRGDLEKSKLTVLFDVRVKGIVCYTHHGSTHTHTCLSVIGSWPHR